MALPAAIIIGGVAAIGLPYLLRDGPEAWDGFARTTSVHFAVGQARLDFSWPVFCVATLLVWLLLRAARSG